MAETTKKVLLTVEVVAEVDVAADPDSLCVGNGMIEAEIVDLDGRYQGRVESWTTVKVEPGPPTEEASDGDEAGAADR